MKNTSIMLLRSGVATNMDILSENELQHVLGGGSDVQCQQGYMHSILTGTVCACGYLKQKSSEGDKVDTPIGSQPVNPGTGSNGLG